MQAVLAAAGVVTVLGSAIVYLLVHNARKRGAAEARVHLASADAETLKRVITILQKESTHDESAWLAARKREAAEVARRLRRGRRHDLERRLREQRERANRMRARIGRPSAGG